MKNPKEFIEESLLELVTSFKQILCKYEFHSLSDAHYIEINPSEHFNDLALKESLANIMFSFYDQFPNESIVFITETDGIHLETCEVAAKGADYVPTWTCLFTEIEDEVYIDPILCGNYSIAA